MADETVDIDIGEVVTKDLIDLDIKSNTKEDVIAELTDLLVAHGDVIDRQGFIDDVLLREAEGITGLGQGVAIPHGKSKAVKNTTIAIGISKHDIPWESLDDEPIRVIILFAVRDIDANTLHIKLLQKVAVLLSDDDFIENLHKVNTKDELISLLRKDPEGEDES
ncbi:fructose-specific PTS system IIA component [Lactiplantibacillus paraplantarum]|uniref:Fructose-specific PTS system IIA component n=1 Tax=Lactiplantibacillus paraplantarum TaxID=60520 RepID=A0ABQ0NEX2_9LACO|nr:fructose PTS transporter subunit IIA [Lactiplantibacillus paraplantarum]GBF03628.1 fructose-specific PTS system IIA component [Lactiplantibacillus paraplantarum]